uniref:Phospholipase A1 n=1 Tax=Brassica oleracea var. oleracea TaxID=109376 RepID=A0A0D3BKA7_BRAOL
MVGMPSVFRRLKDLRVLRVKNLPDVVPIYPPLGYAEVGDELPIDTRKSPYLKSPGDLATFHCLEAYLHGLAGTQGTSRADLFRLDVKRDIGLVNKSVDGLKDEYMVPGHWRILKNKGMKPLKSAGEFVRKLRTIIRNLHHTLDISTNFALLDHKSMAVDSSLLSATLPATTLTAAWLAPGFRFHPTDEALVSYYLISTSMSFGTFQVI